MCQGGAKDLKKLYHNDGNDDNYNATTTMTTTMTTTNSMTTTAKQHQLRPIALLQIKNCPQKNYFFCSKNNPTLGYKKIKTAIV